MKRIFAVIASICLLGSSVFAKGFLDSRIFEVRTSVPLALSNNCFALNDILKENVVIDFSKISAGLPKEGFSAIMTANPEVQMNLNIANVSVGVGAGVNFYGKMTLSDGIFDFLGEGLLVGETLDITLTPKIDVFAYTEANIGLKFSRFNIYVCPGVFAPLFSVSSSSGGINIVNSEDGSITLTMDANLNLYSTMDFGSSGGFDDINFDFSAMSMGFDLSAGTTIPLTKRLSASADVRIPLVPGTLKNLTTASIYSQTTLSLSSLDGFDFSIPDPEFSAGTEVNYKVHRPFKLMGYVDYCPLGNLLDLRGGLGMGIYHPFAQDDSTQAYVQYYLGATLNLINLLKFTLSTEYTDQMFIHQLGVNVNVRLVELDAGISMQSSSFARSWLVSGVGAYVVVCVGF